MTDAFLTTIKTDIAMVASEGQRVIALAQRVLPETEYPADFTFQTEPTPNYPLEDLTFVACLAVSIASLLSSPLPPSHHYCPPPLTTTVL